MSDAYELLQAGSTVSGDTWTMLNNLGGGGGIGQVVENLEGTVMASEELQGIVTDENIEAEVSQGEVIGTIDIDNLEGEITDTNLQGEV